MRVDADSDTIICGATISLGARYVEPTPTTWLTTTSELPILKKSAYGRTRRDPNRKVRSMQVEHGDGRIAFITAPAERDLGVVADDPARKVREVRIVEIVRSGLPLPVRELTPPIFLPNVSPATICQFP